LYSIERLNEVETKGNLESIRNPCRYTHTVNKNLINLIDENQEMIMTLATSLRYVLRHSQSFDWKEFAKKTGVEYGLEVHGENAQRFLKIFMDALESPTFQVPDFSSPPIDVSLEEQVQTVTKIQEAGSIAMNNAITCTKCEEDAKKKIPNCSVCGRKFQENN